MKFIIIEDEKAAIEFWLTALAGNEQVNESIRNEAKLALTIDWETVVVNAKGSSDHLSNLPRGLAYLSALSGSSSPLIFGVDGEHLAILLVTKLSAEQHVASWLNTNMPSRCISFLDYKLADNDTAQIAERLAPLLACGPVQLCVNHSTVMGQLDAPLDLGLTEERLHFYKRLSDRLGHIKEAKNCLNEALEFWNKWNSKFTGVEEIDQIINWYVLCKTDQQNGPRFNDHDQLGLASSPVRTFLRERGFGTGMASDDFKGLFRCSPDCAKVADLKKVSPAGLRKALNVLRLSDATYDPVNGPNWTPPFLPGILFLCQLRLMKDAFSDPKDGRSPPALTLTRKTAVFTFAENIEDALAKKIYDWKLSNAGGAGCSAMRAMRNGCIGEPSDSWKLQTSASLIKELLEGKEESICVTPSGNNLTISWDV